MGAGSNQEFTFSGGQMKSKIGGSSGCITAVMDPAVDPSDRGDIIKSHKLSLWAKKQPNGGQAVFILSNQEDTGSGGGSGDGSVRFTFDEIGLAAGETCTIRDVWARKTIGRFESSFATPPIGGHGSLFYTVSNCSAAAVGSAVAEPSQQTPPQVYLKTDDSFAAAAAAVAARQLLLLSSMAAAVAAGPMLLHISALIATVAIGQAVLEQAGGALPHTLAGSGSFDFLTAESSPVYFRGEVYVAETIDMWYNDSLTQPNRTLAHCASYYRVRHAVSGEVVVNISESCDHSFLAAFVDTAPNGTSILWLFGTPWRRSIRGHGWSGDCANATTCHIDAFYTHDLQHWWAATNVLVPG